MRNKRTCDRETTRTRNKRFGRGGHERANLPQFCKSLSHI